MKQQTVVLRTEKEAEHMWLLLKEILGEKGFDIKERLSYLDRNSTSFKKGLTVTTFYLAKGLEFDQVFAVFRRKIRARLCVRRDISLQQEPFMNCICMKWKNKKVIVTVHSVHSNVAKFIPDCLRQWDFACMFRDSGV